MTKITITKLEIDELPVAMGLLIIFIISLLAFGGKIPNDFASGIFTMIFGVLGLSLVFLFIEEKKYRVEGKRI